MSEKTILQLTASLSEMTKLRQWKKLHNSTVIKKKLKSLSSFLAYEFTQVNHDIQTENTSLTLANYEQN